ncbi:general substrate transporter [Cryphonectria parasitica EP155]|uniref:General substrate transporter n=1 Tax=Cryphonectria parasitica (strain ATCC 38755 / EP155) TaxID=660469 RepID=A0A9P4Y2L4_CRYP1|nr:general substrate transporter [Cryphonectria parasitica EP155]KAF3765329.1 general substrate transporter [Cryphonectria parasitica EP155]
MAPKVGNIYFIAATAVVGGGLFGFDISSMSAFIGEQPYACKFNTQGMDNGTCLGPSANVQGGITAAMPGGSWLGSLVSGFLSDRFGRKTSIQIGCVIWVIGSILCSAAQNIPMLIVGRIINGFCVGICSAQVPVYISEIAPPSKRGRLVSMQQWAITWGILIMFFICYGCSFINSEASFRIPWAVQMVPAILLGAALFFLPESPRWLAKQDRWEEALECLVLVHGHGDPNAPFVHQEMEEIRAVVEFERQNADVTYLELFKPHMINRTMIGVFTQIWSQLTGMNVMMYYIVYIFNMAGIGSATLLSSGIDYIINVIMTIPALIWLDNWGRRPTLLIGALFMCLWMSVNAGLFAVYSVPATPHEFDSDAESMSIKGPAAKAVIASTYLFVASYAPTWGPVSWTYPPELYPLRTRGKAVALATSANWAFNFALAYFVPPAFANITWKTYVLFAVFCFAMFVHVLFMFPETANKTLEEVVDIFDDTKPGAVKYIGQPAWKTKNHRANVVRLEQGDAEAKLDRPSNEHVDHPSPAAEEKI